MTVSELIKALQKLPPDMPVMDSSWQGTTPLEFGNGTFQIGRDRRGAEALFVDTGEASTSSILKWKDLEP